MKRREMVATSGVVFGVFTAGCSAVSSRIYSFSLYNNSQDDHTFSVEIVNTSNNTVYNNSLELDAEAGTEGVTIDDVPARIILYIDSSEEYTFAWPASSTEEGEIATHAEIDYDLRGESEISVTGT